MDEGQVHLRLSLPADYQTTVVLKPGKAPFDLPAAPEASQRSSILCLRSSSIRSVRRDELDTSSKQSFAEWVAVVGLVGDQTFRARTRSTRASPRYADRAQGFLDERDLRRRGGVYGYSDRYTLAVDHHHALRTLATLGLANCVAPLFAGTKVASANDSFQSRQPLPSSSERSVLQTRSHVPSPSHSLKRRQQVAGLG